MLTSLMKNLKHKYTNTLTAKTMTKEQILEGNKLICAFMGVKPKLIGNSYVWSDSPFFSSSNSTEEKTMQAIIEYSKYHSSWDWLMPVCKKAMDTDMVSDGVENLLNDMTGAFHNVDIEELYNAVIEFIKWFNENK